MDRRLTALWLTMAWGAGNRRIEEMLARMEDPERFCASICGKGIDPLTAFLSPAEIAKLRKIPPERVKDGWRKTQALGFRMLCKGDADYPSRLSETAGSPEILFVEGDLGDLDREVAIAVVGTRRITAYGEKVTERLSLELAEEGVTIVSGMALGADGIAHRAALDRGARTIAVLACGLDTTYPPEHKDLRRLIAHRGAIVSEQPLGSPPLAGYFPRRNRIITGLSLGVLVTEAPHRSGALISARHAAEQGRDVFVAAPPEGHHAERNEGAELLLQDGAIPVRSARDILAAYEASYQLERVTRQAQVAARLEQAYTPAQGERKAAEAMKVLPENLSTGAVEVWKRLETDILSADELAAATGFTMPQLLTALTELELEGLVMNLPGRRYAKT